MTKILVVIDPREETHSALERCKEISPEADARAAPGSLARPPRHGVTALAGSHRECRGAHDTAAGTPSVAHLGEEGDVAQANAARHVDLAPLFHGEAGQPVDVAGLEAGICNGLGDRLAGERELAVLEWLAEASLADSDDRGSVPDGLGHRALRLLGRWSQSNDPTDSSGSVQAK